MKFFKKAVSLILTAAIMAAMICTGTVCASADNSSEYSVSTGSTEDGSYFIKVTTSEFFTIDLFADRLTDHYVTLEYFCDDNTYTLMLDYRNRFPYAVFHVDDDFNTDRNVWDYDWNTTRVNNKAINSYIYLYAKSEEQIKDLKTCSKIRFTCSEANQSRVVLEDITLSVKSKSDTTKPEKTEPEKIDISSLQFSELSDYACTGANIKAKVTVKDGSYTLEKGIDYSLTYKNCKNIGTASVTIKGIGKYTGEKTLKYNIVPRKTTLKISKKSDSKVKLTWEKSMGAEKYQIYYSTNGGAYKKLATLLESSNYAVIANLNFKKNDYKFKIRSYATEDGTKYYSSYSNTIFIR